MIGRIAPSRHGVARQDNVTYCELLLITPKPLFTDFDECSNATIFPCHPVANCTNTVGSFSCTCLSGYTGDGMTCDGEKLQYIVN